MVEEDIRVAIDESEPPGGPRLRGPSSQVTLLTMLILTLLAILLGLVGVQAIETERYFFRNVTLQVNQEIADLLAQQVVQVFTAATGLVEDMSHYPSVRRSMAPGADVDTPQQLLDISTGRNPVLRSLVARDREGAELYRSVAIGADAPRPFPAPLREDLLGGSTPSLLAPDQFVSPGEVLAMSFATAVREPGRMGQVQGTLEAELSLEFLKKLVATVQVGTTGEVLVVNQKGEVVVSTLGFTPAELSDFQRAFPVERAFQTEAGGIAYGGETGTRGEYLAAYRDIQSVSRKRFDAELVVSASHLALPFTSGINPREIPRWVVVVQQDLEEGLALANRMRMNILLLVGIGLVGLVIIARLWWDSISAG